MAALGGALALTSVTTAFNNSPAGQQVQQAFNAAMAKAAYDTKETLTNIVSAAKDGISNTCTYFFISVDRNSEHYKAAKAKAKELAEAYTDRKSTGSYTITFASGKTYSGKGNVNRAIESAAERSSIHTTMPVGIDWTPAASHADAFEQEYIRIQTHGGPMSRHPDDVSKNVHPNYNIIQSPGEAIYFMRHGTIYKEINPNSME